MVRVRHSEEPLFRGATENLSVLRCVLTARVNAPYARGVRRVDT